MLEELRVKYDRILRIYNYDYKRYFFDIVDFDNKLIGLAGARGKNYIFASVSKRV